MQARSADERRFTSREAAGELFTCGTSAYAITAATTGAPTTTTVRATATSTVPSTASSVEMSAPATNARTLASWLAGSAAVRSLASSSIAVRSGISLPPPRCRCGARCSGPGFPSPGADALHPASPRAR